MAKVSRIARALYVLALTVWALTSSGQTKGPGENANAERAANIHGQLWHDNDVETIAQHLARTTGFIIVVNDEDRIANDGAHQIAPPYPPIRMVEFACQSDAVVVGTPESGVSHMTADLSFIYSEWKVRISSVLQDNPKAPIFGSKEISVVRAGGLLTINGRSVIGKELNFPQFQPNDEYLLYLKYIPETGFYKAIAGRSFDLSHGPVPDAPYMDRSWDKVPVDELLRDTRTAISAAGTAAYCWKGGNQRHTCSWQSSNNPLGRADPAGQPLGQLPATLPHRLTQEVHLTACQVPIPSLNSYLVHTTGFKTSPLFAVISGGLLQYFQSGLRASA